MWTTKIISPSLSFLRALLKQPHIAALADQTVVSATSFGTIIIVARYSNSHELGLYSFFLSLIAVAIAFQDALIVLPYTIRRHRPDKNDREEISKQFMLAGLLSALAALLTSMASAIVWVVFRDESLALILAILAVVFPINSLRELVKRVDLAHLKTWKVFLFDLVIGAVQMSGLVAAIHYHYVTSLTAIFILSLSSFFYLLTWLYFASLRFVLVPPKLVALVVSNVELGKWFLLSHGAAVLRGYLVPWLLLVFDGASTVGVFTVSSSIVAIASPVLYGLGSILPARSGLAWKAGGAKALRVQVGIDTVLLGAILGLFCIVLWAGGDRLISILYVDAAFQNQGGVILFLALSSFATALGLPAANAIASIEKPRALVLVTCVGTAVTCGLVLLLLLYAGLVGAAAGLFFGNAFGTICRWLAFLVLVPRDPTLQGLRELAQVHLGVPIDNISIRRLGDGDDAVSFSARANSPDGDQRGATTANEVVIKLFRNACEASVQESHKQFLSLRRLHELVAQSEHPASSIRAPRAIQLSAEPLAIVMTPAAGHELDLLVRTNILHVRSIDDLATTLAVQMSPLWQNGVCHGDFGLQNVFYDDATKTISLIDPGTPASCEVCCGKPRATDVAALDIGHLVADFCMDIATFLGRGSVRNRYQRFIEGVVRNSISIASTHRDERAYLAAIRQSAATHLEFKLCNAQGTRGLWHQFVLWVASKRLNELIDSMCDAVRNDEYARRLGYDPNESRARALIAHAAN